MAKVTKSVLERWNDRRDSILARNFDVDYSPLAKEARIQRARKDYNYFVKTYFPDIAKCESAPFQIEAANYILKHPNARAVLEWARGHAKSTHLSLFIPMWLKIQERRQINVMILASKSNELATRLLSDIQAELEFNALFISDFGAQVGGGNWTDGEFRTADGCLFVAYGRGQTPRGIKDRGQRPDYIVIDDIDDDELVRNPVRVGEALDWCLTALIGTMAMGRGRFIMVGNRIGKDSILSRMAERPNFYHTVVNALDKKGLPSWSANYTAEEINSIRITIGERRFQKEFMNNPINEGSVFLQKQIKFGPMLDNLRQYGTLICYTDPSFKASTTADFKATMLVGKTKKGEYHVLKAYVAQTTVTAMVQWHYDIHQWVNGRTTVMYYMESNFLQDLILEEFRKEGNSIGMQIPIRGDSRKKPDKFARIEAMQPNFERGFVLLNENEAKSEGMLQLVDQLLMFEKGSRTHDDAPDALEGAISLLTKRTAVATPYSFGRRENRKY